MALRRAILSAAIGASALALTAPATAEPVARNWTPPAYRIYAQALSDDMMAHHPELWSVTFHGVSPGMDKVYTMFAGSYPDRIGNPDDPDDVDVIVKGITSVDPRWRRHDAFGKFVLQMPLRDRNGENIGLLVLAYRIGPVIHMGERDYYAAGTMLRDQLENRIPDYASLFARTP